MDSSLIRFQIHANVRLKLTTIACDSNCFTCDTTATNCLSCHAELVLTSSSIAGENFCLYCKDNTGANCNSCPSNCLHCDDQRCLKCNTGDILNLQTYSCDSSCPVNMQLLKFSQGTQVCRPWEFYIDTHSEAKVEIGTFEYPYKVGTYAFNELINGSPYSPLEMVKNSQQIKMLVKHGVEHNFNFMQERWDVIGQYDFLIGTYDPDTGEISDQTCTIIYDDFSSLPESALVPFLDQVQEPDWQSRMDKGELYTYEFRDVWGRMTFFRSNIIVQNINFTDITTNTDDLSYAFRLFGSPGNKVKYFNVNFSTIFVAIATYEGYFIEVYNSQIDVSRQYFVNSDLGGQGCLLEATTGILIENSRFYNFASDSQWYMIGSAEGGDLIVRNNYFYEWNFGGSNAAIQYYNSKFCSESVTTIDISNNVFDGSAAPNDLSIYMTSEVIVTNAEAIGTQDFIVKYNNNTFKDTYTTDVLLLIQSTMNAYIEINENTFYNCKLEMTSAPFSVQANGGELMMHNTHFKNTATSMIIDVSLPDIMIVNMTVLDGYQTTSSSRDFLVLADSSTSFILRDLNITNSDITAGGLIRAQETHEIDIENIVVAGSTIGIENLISLNLVQSGLVKNIYIQDIPSGFTKPALIYIGLVETSNISPTSLTFQNLTIINSDLTVASVQGTEGGSMQSRVIFSNIKTSDITMSAIYPIFLLGEYESSILTVEIVDSTFSQMEADVIEVNCNSDAIIRNCSFDQISGRPLIVSAQKQEKQFRDAIVTLIDSNFTNIFGGDDALISTTSKSQLHICNSFFKENYSNGRGSVLLADQVASLISVEDSVFENNAAIKGGVAYTHRSSKVTFKNSIFTKNYAVEGGIIYANDDGTFMFTNCSFKQNSAQIGNVFFMINSDEESSVDTCSFNRNLIGQVTDLPPSIKQAADTFQSEPLDVPINMQKSILTVIGEIILLDQPNLFQASVSSLITFRDVQIEDIYTQNLVTMTDSNLVINNVVFNNIQSTSYLFILPVGCTLTVDNFMITNSTALVLEAAVSQVLLKDFIISNHTCFYGQQLLYLSGCDHSKMISSTFVNITEECEVVKTYSSEEIAVHGLTTTNVQGIVFDIEESSIEFRDITASELTSHEYTGLAISSFDSQVSIIDSTFFNIISDQDGSAVYAQMTINSQYDSKLIIRNSIFSNNTALNGGAIKSYNMDTEIETSTFIENSAIEQGGAVFLSCDKGHAIGCPSIIKETIFENNVAGLQGGGIEYDLHPPVISASCTFTNNAAESGYGNNVASYAAYLAFTDSNAIWNDAVSVTSGHYLPEDIQMAFYDWDGNVVTTQNNSLVTLSADASSIGDISIQGSFSYQSTNGILFISQTDITFKAQQGVSVGIDIRSTVVDDEIFGRFNDVEGQSVSPHLSLEFGLCSKGEIFKDLECVECSINEYVIELGQVSCLACPSHITCPGGAVMQTNKGYWRSHQESVTAIECLDTTACLGGQDSECAEAYEGILCHDCKGFVNDTYYGRSGNYSCAACGSTSTTIIVIFLLLLVALIYVIVMMVLIIRGVHSEKDHSVLLRIITNYMQLLLLVYNLDLQWPDNIKSLFDALTFVSSASNNIIQVGCLWQEFEDVDFKLSLVSLTVLFFALLPFAIGIITLFVWRLLALCRKSFENTYRRNAISMTIIFVFLLYPSITTFTFQMFDCINIEGVSYLRRDFSVECWKSGHMQQIFSIALPTLIIWIAGFPIIIFLILRKYRKQLDQPDMIIKYGLWYIGLQHHSYYWEIVVVNLRKVIFIALTVSLSKTSQKLQVLCCLIIVFITMLLIKKIHPYKKDWLNFTEDTSLLAAVFTMSFGFMLLEPATHGSETGLMFLFVCITAVNVAFLLYWSIRMIMVIHIKYKHWKKKRKIAKKAHMDTSMVASHMFISPASRSQQMSNTNNRSVQEGPSNFMQDEEIKTEENQGMPPDISAAKGKGSKRGLIDKRLSDALFERRDL